MYAPTYLWAKVLMHLRKYYPEDLLSTWFDGTEVIGLIDNTLIIHAPSSFSRQTIQEKCMPYILESLNSIALHKIGFTVWSDTELMAYRIRKKIPLPQFTFDNFITGSSNRDAVNTLKAAVENTNEKVPICLCGPAGSGKTHLLHAFMHSLLQSLPETHVVCVNSDQFTAEMIFSLRHGEMDNFRQKYYNTDMLLVDDIQYFAGKKTVQEEFSHIFNSLIQKKKQIILTLDRSPKETPEFEECLKDYLDISSRVKIYPPDHDTRLSIIHSKAQAHNLTVSNDIFEFISTVSAADISKIDYLLNKIRFFDEFTKTKQTPLDLRQFLEETLYEDAPLYNTMPTIHDPK